MSKEDRFYIFIAMLAVVIVVIVNMDKIWNKLDMTYTAYSRTDDTNDQLFSYGSADANEIRNIQVAWEKGDVNIDYAPQERITWYESFTEGNPSQFNMMQYWMNTLTLFINYYSQEYGVVPPHLRRNVHKNLNILIPNGCIMNEIIVHAEGEVHCNVQSNTLQTN